MQSCFCAAKTGTLPVASIATVSSFPRLGIPCGRFQNQRATCRFVASSSDANHSVGKLSQYEEIPESSTPITHEDSDAAHELDSWEPASPSASSVESHSELLSLEAEKPEDEISDWDDWETMDEEAMVPLDVLNAGQLKTKTSWAKEEEDTNRRFKLVNGREVFMERTYLVGVEWRQAPGNEASLKLLPILDSLEELAQLADTAGLEVVGGTYQKLNNPNPRTYIGAGKVSEIKTAIDSFGVETVVFDDELSPGQLRNLEREFGQKVRVCDRTALILDIFSQRAATKEAVLQVELAATEYQLPRLTRMWSHLERQAGGLVKGMGEKQKEVDKRILRNKIGALKQSLESVRAHRQQYRERRATVPVPVVSLVGYTNAGKSTMLNLLSGSQVLAEDKLFATLDPITRRVTLPNGKECLFSDTVGFIQKLPTQLVAAFRATLEEIAESSLILTVQDISHPMAELQMAAVQSVLSELDVSHIPSITVWNQIDKCEDPAAVREEARKQEGTVVCMSAVTGEGLEEFYSAVEGAINATLVYVEALLPYRMGDVLDLIHRIGAVDSEEYLAEGTFVSAHVPQRLASQLLPFRYPAAAMKSPTVSEM